MSRSLRKLNTSKVPATNMAALPDALDFQIIEALRADPITTNKAMAHSFGVAEPTIAARIRGMAERDVMRVTVQRDLTALGFPVFAFLDVFSDGRSPSDIAADLVEIEEATSVVTSLGGPEILVNLYAKTDADLQSLIEGPISSIRGIRRVELHVCLETLKQLSGYGILARGGPKHKKPKSSEAVDEAVISLLAEDGRRSNRDMARKLDLSEGAIRQRLKRLTEGKAIKRGVICDPKMIGQTSSALARMWVDPPHIRALKTALCHSPFCFFAAKTTGRFNFIALFVADTLESIETAITDVTSGCAGVLDVDVKVIIRGFKHRYDLVNLV